jgi:hypothetical protein
MEVGKDTTCHKTITPFSLRRKGQGEMYLLELLQENLS